MNLGKIRALFKSKYPYGIFMAHFAKVLINPQILLHCSRHLNHYSNDHGFFAWGDCKSIFNGLVNLVVIRNK
jgi:hypothetical protein